MAKVNVGLRIPAVHPTDPDGLRQFVARAEALGFHSIWVGNHIFYHVDVPDSLHMLTWVAAQTSRVRIGTSVMLSSYLNPVLLAKAAATLDCLSGGRLTLGMSIGGTEAEYSSIGVPMNQRVGRLLENVRIMRRLWREEEGVEYEGRYFKIEKADIRPKPVQRPIPIYFGAASEPMFRRLARVADGWVAGSGGRVESYLERIEQVRGYAREAGRDPDRLGFVKQHNVSVHSDHDEAFRRAERHWKTYYGERFDVERNAVFGTVDECAAVLAGFAATTAPELTLALEPASLDLDELERLREATRGL
jgi:probable F420-dependent oxidoreductase